MTDRIWLARYIRRMRAQHRAEVQHCEREIGHLARQLADLQLGLKRVDPEAKITAIPLPAILPFELDVEPVEPERPAPRLRQKLLTELEHREIVSYVISQEKQEGKLYLAVEKAMELFRRARSTIHEIIAPYR
jgi:hypothetical protein